MSKQEATRLADALDDSFCPMCHQAAALLRQWPNGEPSRPDILERLTYHALERDDLTLGECLDYLARGWTKVRGRTERQMVLQVAALLAGGPDQSERIAALEAENAMLPCGHHASMMLMSAETGNPLYCEACDDKTGRRDAELVADEQRTRIAALESALEQAQEALGWHASACSEDSIPDATVDALRAIEEVRRG